MRGYLEDLKAGGRPMTDKELAEHYKHLYSEVKKQKDDVVEYITSEESINTFTTIESREQWLKINKKLLRMLGEIDE